jgi:uncharacterized protein
MNQLPVMTTKNLAFVCAIFIFSCSAAEPVHQQGESEQYVENNGQIESETGNPDRLHILFLGDDGHHQPSERLQQIVPQFAEMGIYFHYTDRQEDLNLKNLQKYDALMLFGNRSEISKRQESDLLTYVHEGGALVAVHSASSMFNNSDAFINLVGGAFKAHGAGTFQVEHVERSHPVKLGVPQFESRDETYVHMKLNPDKTVLSVRIEGDHEEPWTWVRNHGDGRVFYTAWGHDQQTWGQEGFQQLLNNAIRWAVGDWALDADFSPPEITFGEGKLPYYPPGEPWGTTGDPITEVQNPLSPEESLEHIVARPGFRVELFASEEQVINPIDMAWDEQGRLWVTETVDYPNKFLPDREGNDRIKILEDTTGDGRADNVTVFADGLNIPTSLVLVNGGVIVSQAPDVIFLKDTTGDDKADHKEVLFTGWGTFDTHAGPSNLRYGFDNQIWGTVGYSAFEGTVGGEDHQFSSGLFRFKPDGSRLEYISNTTNNTWGLGFNEEGIVFGSTANRDVPVHSAVPNRFYDMIRGFGDKPRLPMLANSNRIYPLLEEVRQVDQHGRYTAGSGFEVYSARDFPEEYWNRKSFISEPTGHLLGEFILEPSGSSYRAINTRNKLASRDEWFSPIQAKVGPDGALWVLDWYNLVIQHNPTPDEFETGEGNAYITELRDQDHARIYRIVHIDSDHRQPLNLKDASAEELVSALSSDNLFWRKTAQRLLVEREETEVVPQLLELVYDQRTDRLGMNPAVLHSLWTLNGLGVINENNPEVIDAVIQAMHHPALSVRRAALMILPRNEEMLNQILEAGILPDPSVPGEMSYTMPVHTMMAADPQIRLAALLAVAEMPPSERAGRAVAELVALEENANDRWIRDAATAAAAQNEHSFLNYLLDKQLPEDADSTYRANVGWVAERIAGHMALGDDPEHSLFALLVKLEGADPAIGSAFVEGLTENWPDDLFPQFSDAEKLQLERLKPETAGEVREGLKELAEAWETPGLFGRPVAEDVAVEPEDQPGHHDHYTEEEDQPQDPDEVHLDEEVTEVSAGDTLTVRSFGADLSYDVTEIRANAGETITIRYDNTESEMPHNIVFVNSEADIHPVGIASIQAYQNEYIPTDEESLSKIIGYTRLARPGEVVYVTITVPPPGTYPYICTYPGHFTMMQGRLISQ